MLRSEVMRLATYDNMLHTSYTEYIAVDKLTQQPAIQHAAGRRCRRITSHTECVVSWKVHHAMTSARLQQQQQQQPALAVAFSLKCCLVWLLWCQL
jgi:hypothetical protein